MLVIQVSDRKYFTSYFYTPCFLIHQQKVPSFTVLTYMAQDDFTYVQYNINLSNCDATSLMHDWSMRERPLIGDHIHIGMVLSVSGEVMNFHDRNMSEPIPYEDNNKTCSSPKQYAYEKRWYHNGVHTHCDGNIIHVHPWSAPEELRVEGREVRLKMWFESVGMEVSPNKQGLRLPGQQDYIYEWEMEYYVHVNDPTPMYRSKSVEEIINFWLVDHHGEFLLWSGQRKPEKDYQVLEYKSHPVNYPKRYYN